MSRNIAKPFKMELSIIDINTIQPKYRCFFTEDVELFVTVKDEDKQPLDLSSVCVKVFFINNGDDLRQDDGITITDAVNGKMNIMVRKNYIRLGTNTVRIVLFDADQEVFLQPFQVACIDSEILDDSEIIVDDDFNVRDEFLKVRSEIDEVEKDLSSSLENITNQQISDILNIKNPQVETTKKPILVFVDDDTRIETYTYWHRLAKEKGIRISLGVVPDWIENGSTTTTVPPGKPVMSKSQLKEMYDYGHDLLSHGYDTRSLKDFLNNPTELKHQLLDSKQWLIDNGYTRYNMYDYFVYPQGLNGTTQENLLTKAEVRKYYRYGINAFTALKNVSGVFDSFDMPRVTGDNVTGSDLKMELDKIIANKGLMIVLTHAYKATDDKGGDYDAWSQPYKELIDYANNNNVSILPFSEAIKIKGNVLSIGEYTSDGTCYINNDGSTKFIQKKRFSQFISDGFTIGNTVTTAPFRTKVATLNPDLLTADTLGNFTTLAGGLFNINIRIGSDGVVPADSVITCMLYKNETEVLRVFQTKVFQGQYFTLTGSGIYQFQEGESCSVRVSSNNGDIKIHSNRVTTNVQFIES